MRANLSNDIDNDADGDDDDDYDDGDDDEEEGDEDEDEDDFYRRHLRILFFACAIMSVKSAAPRTLFRTVYLSLQHPRRLQCGAGGTAAHQR